MRIAICLESAGQPDLVGACASSCRLLAYDRSFYGGERHDFSGTVQNLGAEWDDKISSMVVSCRRRTDGIRIHPTR